MRGADNPADPRLDVKNVRVVRILEFPHTFGGTRPAFQIPHLDTAIVRRTNKAHRPWVKRQRANELFVARERLDTRARRCGSDLDLLIVRARDNEVASEFDAC